MTEADSSVIVDPQFPGGYAIRAVLHRIKGNRAAMGKDCERCAEIPLDDPDELMQRAQMLEFACQRRDLAIRDLTRAIEIAPPWSEPYDDRGLTNRRGGNLEAALADYTKAIELAPKGFASYDNRAIVYARMERSEQAIADHTTCIELGGDHHIVRNNRRIEYERLGRFDEALADIDRIAELVPESNRAQRYRGEVHRAMGRLDDALRSYDEAVEAGPTDVSAYLGRAALLALTPGGCERAMADLEKARSLRPKLDSEVAQSVGMVHAGLIAQSCPESFDARLALEMGRQMVQMNPEMEGGHRLLALALYCHGRNSEALEAIDRAFELSEGVPSAGAYFIRSMIHHGLGQSSRARSEYDRGVQRMMSLYPNDVLLQVYREEAASLLDIRSPRSMVN